MQARINTIAFSGLDVLDVDLQVQISSGMPAFNMSGFRIRLLQKARNGSGLLFRLSELVFRLSVLR